MILTIKWIMTTALHGLFHIVKGVAVIKEIKDTVSCMEGLIGKLVCGVKEIFESVFINLKYKQFFEDVKKLTGAELLKRYYRVDGKTKIITFIRKYC